MFKNIIDLIEKLKTEEECINLFMQLRWKDGKVKCPFKECKANEFNDENNKIYHFKDGKRFECSSCCKIFSYKTGSIMENTKIPVKKWFLAIYLHTSHKKGISSCQLAKDLSITQKTAWMMLHKIRAVAGDFNNDKFEGNTEMDETYYGAKAENKNNSIKKEKAKNNKVVVFGMVNRDTKQVKSMKVESAEYHILGKEVIENIKEGSTLITDGHKSYITLGKIGYNHKSVNHEEKEFVRNETDSNRKAFKVHTNTIEGYWSLLKRGINGIYHWVSEKHINKYLKEFEFRYNTKEMKEFERFNYFFNKIEVRLNYKMLTR